MRFYQIETHYLTNDTLYSTFFLLKSTQNAERALKKKKRLPFFLLKNSPSFREKILKRFTACACGTASTLCAFYNVHIIQFF